MGSMVHRAVGAGRGLRGGIAGVVLVTVALVGAPNALADPGDLDTTFSGDGYLNVGFDYYLAEGLLTVDAAERTVQASLGEVYVDGGGIELELLLRRRLPDGRADPSYGGDGEVAIDLPVDVRGYPSSVYVLADGVRVVVVVTLDTFAPPFRSELLVARITATGELDPAFNDDGIFRRAARENLRVERAAVLPDHRVALWTPREFGGAAHRFTRLTASGRLDRTLTGDGVLDVDAAITDVEFLANGKFYALEYPRLGRVEHAVARRLATGGLDPGFGGDGRRQVECPPLGAFSRLELVADASGRPLLGCPFDGPTFDTHRLRLHRLTTAGTDDVTFSGDGRLNVTLPSERRASSHELSVDAMRRPVVVSIDEAREEPYLVRLYTSGLFDRTFANRGYTTVATPDAGAYRTQLLAATATRYYLGVDTFLSSQLAAVEA
jgi:hypothetical protein